MGAVRSSGTRCQRSHAEGPRHAHVSSCPLTVQPADPLTDKNAHRHQGYGFVEFISEEDADYAIKIMNMIKLYGKPIRVNKASAHQKNLDVGANIFIGNLDPDVDEKLLYDTFSAFGVILQTPKIMRDPESGNSKGYAFINFASFDASDAAIEAMNGQYLCNRPITISYAFKKDAKGERHGSAAERLLAAQNPLSQSDRPHQLFADAPPTAPGLPATAAAVVAPVPMVIPQLAPGAGLPMHLQPPPPPQFNPYDPHQHLQQQSLLHHDPNQLMATMGWGMGHPAPGMPHHDMGGWGAAPPPMPPFFQGFMPPPPPPPPVSHLSPLNACTSTRLTHMLMFSCRFCSTGSSWIQPTSASTTAATHPSTTAAAATGSRIMRWRETGDGLHQTPDTTGAPPTAARFLVLLFASCFLQDCECMSVCVSLCVCVTDDFA